MIFDKRQNAYFVTAKSPQYPEAWTVDDRETIVVLGPNVRFKKAGGVLTARQGAGGLPQLEVTVGDETTQLGDEHLFTTLRSLSKKAKQAAKDAGAMMVLKVKTKKQVVFEDRYECTLKQVRGLLGGPGAELGPPHKKPKTSGGGTLAPQAGADVSPAPGALEAGGDVTSGDDGGSGGGGVDGGNGGDGDDAQEDSTAADTGE